MQTWRYKDTYGCTATIRELPDGSFQARSCTASGIPIRNTVHKSHALAFSALKRDTDCLAEVK